MIPPFDMGGVLPPFLGDQPGAMVTQSPYRASMEELVHRFGTTPARNQLLRGLVDLRAAWTGAGLMDGFQWIDGSFVEDKETRKAEPPGDIDLITVFNRPSHVAEPGMWRTVGGALAATLFDPGYCKATYHCEAFSIDCGRGALRVAELSAFWFGLFSHQRETYRWKGIVQIPLAHPGDDASAAAELTRRGY